LIVTAAFCRINNLQAKQVTPLGCASPGVPLLSPAMHIIYMSPEYLVDRLSQASKAKAVFLRIGHGLARCRGFGPCGGRMGWFGCKWPSPFINGPFPNASAFTFRTARALSASR